MKPGDFQNQWQGIAEEIQHRLPHWSPESIHQLALAAGSIDCILGKDDLVTLSLLVKHGDPIAVFVAEFCQRQPDLFARLGHLCQAMVSPQTDPFSILMELTHRLPGKSSGVFYTPPPLANYVVQRAAAQLAESGHSLESVHLLEPSVGSGIFACHWLWQALGEKKEPAALEQVLRQMTCIDLSPAALVVAQTLLLQQVSNREFSLEGDLRLPFFAGDTLAAVPHEIYSFLEGLPVPDLQEVLREQRFDLVIGNPPFGSLTGQTEPWIQSLLHGQQPGPAGGRDYFSVQGKPIGQRKTWLHDDYVKFVRFAQWQAEQQVAGCLALVLNSGFLSNLSFQGMRFQLWDAFEQLEIVDFGGDKRNYRDRQDENVFGIETGIASLVATTSAAGSTRKTFTRLNGPRAQKLAWCDPTRETGFPLSVQQNTISCGPPNFRFDISAQLKNESFQGGWCLDEIFKKKWSAPVTARDHLVIDRSRKNLVSRIEQFVDIHQSDEQTREQMFPAPRSQRYPRGDTRGWNLARARQELANSDWSAWIRRCAYRPFDFRFILWHPSMIDWPRRELAQALEIPGNSCLVARRQSPANLDYHYFWATREVPIDGILRNDNRGNETCFPLYTATGGAPGCNLEEPFIHLARQTWKSNDVTQEFLFSLIYSLFHATQYRSLFKNDLAEQFPRFFFPRGWSLASELADCGSRLLRLHTTDSVEPTPAQPPSPGDWVKPRFEEGKLILSKTDVCLLEETTWSFQVGSHRVLEKFASQRFKDRFFGGLVPDCQRMIQQIETHLEIIRRLDHLIDSHGGLLQAFDFGRKDHDDAA